MVLTANRNTHKLPILALLFLLFLFTRHTAGQENGYIIMKDGTFKGGIVKRTHNRSTTVEFAEIGSDEFRVLTADDIQEYGFHRGTAYISRPVNLIRNGEVINQSLFLESVETGTVSLFQVMHNAKKYFFIARESSLLVPLNTDPEQTKERFQAALHKSMSDCDAVNDAIELAKLKKRYLATLTRRYNDCDSQIVPRFEVGVFTGLQVSLLDFPVKKTNVTSLSKAQFDAAFSPLVGIQGSLPIEEKLYLQGEVGFTNHSFTYHRSEKSGEDLLEEDIAVDLSRLDVTLSLKYSSLKSRIRPYVHGGVGLAFALNKKNEMTLYERVGGIESIETFDFTDDEMSNYYFKMMVGTGVDFSLSKRLSIFVELRIEELLAGDPPIPNITGIGLVTGLNF